MNHDTIANMFSMIKNAENMGKNEIIIPYSKLIGNVLNVVKESGYVKNYEFIDDGKSGKFRVELNGLINNCNVIRPRFAVQSKGFKKWEKRYLPAEGVGLLIVTTSKGVMSHETAKSENVGGQLIGYVY